MQDEICNNLTNPLNRTLRFFHWAIKVISTDAAAIGARFLSAQPNNRTHLLRFQRNY
jgi:hypothetical protein